MIVPSWLEAFRVPEPTLAAAYEATSDVHRAWIKTTLALVRARYPHMPGQTHTTWSQPDLGFTQSVHATPAPWALYVLASDFASPVRLAASLMTARIASVPELFVVHLASEKAPFFPQELLTATELVGIEHLFSITPDQVLALLAELTDHHGLGRVLIHHAPGATTENVFFNNFAQHAQDRHLPIWHNLPPTLGVTSTETDEDLLRWAHPDACIVPLYASATMPSPYLDAVYDAGHSAPAAPLGLCGHGSDALTGAWFHTTLDPTFFQVQTYSARFDLPSAS